MIKSKVITERIVEIFSNVAKKHNMNMHNSEFTVLKYDSMIYSSSGSLIFSIDKDINENNINISIIGNNNIIENKDVIKLSELVTIKTNTKCISAIDFDTYYEVICNCKNFIDEVKENINKISIKIA